MRTVVANPTRCFVFHLPFRLSINNAYVSDLFISISLLGKCSIIEFISLEFHLVGFACDARIEFSVNADADVDVDIGKVNENKTRLSARRRQQQCRREGELLYAKITEMGNIDDDDENSFKMILKFIEHKKNKIFFKLT